MGYMTDERRMIQETARAFAMKEVLPLANKLDPEKGDIPPELIQKLADMGYFGIVIPEQYGGLGLGVFEYCLITEELARAWMSVASVIARGNGLSAGRGMTEAQRAVFLPRAARGEFLGAAAMSEPNVGSDLGSISFRYHQRDKSDFNYMVHAVGFGIRYRTPVGPLRLDLAYSLNPPAFNGLKGTYQELLLNQATVVPQRVSHFQLRGSAQTINK